MYPQGGQAGMRCGTAHSRLPPGRYFTVTLRKCPGRNKECSAPGCAHAQHRHATTPAPSEESFRVQGSEYRESGKFFNGTPLTDTRHLLAPGTPAAVEDPTTRPAEGHHTLGRACLPIPHSCPRPEATPSQLVHPGTRLPHPSRLLRASAHSPVLEAQGHSEEGSVTTMSVGTQV